MKLSILTLGCKVNQAESALIEGNIRESGFEIVPLSENPDYCVINTCSVTSKSDYQSRQLIRRAIKTGAKVIVTGCYAELRPDEIKQIDDGIDVYNNYNKFNIIKLITNKSESNNLSYSGRSRPYIKVQDGCNYTCSYCIIPKARGRSKSIPVSKIVDQALRLEYLGYHEVVLTGIHLGLFGYDTKPKLSLSTLIKSLLKETKFVRFRLSSVEVNEIDGELIDLLQEKRICTHLHIPLQSGDDRILKRMNRMYTSHYYIDKIERMTKKIPDMALGTDIMVGFPSEGEKEFLNTRNLVDKLPFSYFHIFPFSPRPDTVASRMGDQIEPAVKKKRLKELKTLNDRKKIAYVSSQIGKIFDIIIEEEDNNHEAVGTSGNYLKVKTCSNNYLKKSLIHVRIAGREGDYLRGVPITED